MKESEKRDQYLDLARELKKTVEYENDDDTSRNWRDRYSHRRICKGTGVFRNKSGDHLNYRIVEIGQITEKSPGDLRWLAVTQTPVENH